MSEIPRNAFQQRGENHHHGCLRDRRVAAPTARPVVNVASSKGGFSRQFPLSSRLVALAPVVCALACFAGLVISQTSVPAIGYGIALMGVGLLGIWMDRRHLDNWLLSPGLWFAQVPALSAGLGVIMISLSGGGVPHGLIMAQQAHLIGYAVFFLVWALVWAGAPAIPDFRKKVAEDPGFRRTLVAVGLITLQWALMATIVGVVTGAGDRGVAGEEARAKVFGIWTWFGALGRLNFVGFFLVPLVVARGNWLVRIYAVAAVAVVLVFSMLGGSRQSLLMPPVVMVAGYYSFFRPRFVRLEILGLLLLPFAAMGFTFLEHYRNTAAYQSEAISDPIAKLRAVGEAITKQEDSNETGKSILGERLVGTIDSLVFESTPSIIPHDGFNGADAILWMYVPYFFYKNRPVMQDCNATAERYLNHVLVDTSIGPSLVGDWYRRFGWIGVGIGMGVTALFWGGIIRWLVSRYVRDGSMAALSGILIFSSFSLKDANMTILTLIWFVCYEFLKNGVVLWLIFKACGALYPSKKQRGSNRREVADSMASAGTRPTPNAMGRGIAH